MLEKRAVRVALYGLGKPSQRWIAAIASLSDVELVAVADERSRDAACKFAARHVPELRQSMCFGSLLELIAMTAEEADVVIVASTTDMDAATTIVSAGVSVIAPPALCRSVELARAFATAVARSRGGSRPPVAGYGMRFAAAVTRVAPELERIGAIRLVNVGWISRDPFGGVPDAPGGVFRAFGADLLAPALLAFGAASPTWAMATAVRLTPRGQPSHCLGWVHLEGGGTIALKLGHDPSSGERNPMLELVGTEGSVTHRLGSPLPGLPQGHVFGGGARFMERRRPIPSSRTSLIAATLERFVGALRGEGEPLTTVADGVVLAETVRSFQRSMLGPGERAWPVPVSAAPPRPGPR